MKYLTKKNVSEEVMISIAEFDKSLEKMINRNFTISGYKSIDTEQRIQRRITDLLDSHKSCIIGKTSDPDSRVFRLSQDGYKSMFLIYKSQNIQDVDHYSAFFLDKFTYKFNNKFFMRDDVLQKNGSIHYLFIASKGSR